MNPRRVRNAHSGFAPQGRNRLKNKTRSGRRNSLKTLDPAKRIQGFPLFVFGRAWLDSARAWTNLGLARENKIGVSAPRRGRSSGNRRGTLILHDRARGQGIMAFDYRAPLRHASAELR
jgi:hypothetical protein